MRQVGAGAQQRGGDGPASRGDGGIARRCAEGARSASSTARVGGLVQADAERSASILRRLIPSRLAPRDDAGLADADLDRDRVEEGLGCTSKAGLQRAASVAASAMHPLGDRAQPFGAVVDGVHRGHHRQQHLRGADVAEVAFSRRMCCSRVCSARRRPGLPRASIDTPMMRPGIERLCASVAMKAACGPP
jgi:hypothetical protein